MSKGRLPKVNYTFSFQKGKSEDICRYLPHEEEL